MKFVQLLSVVLLAVLTSAFNVERSKDMFSYLVNLKAGVQNMEKEFAAKLSNVTGALKGYKAEVDSLKKGGKGGGAVFIRWGRTVCPAGNDLVYKGYAAGDHYTHSGAGSNVLCLTEDPVYSQNAPALNSEAVIYGVEYNSKSLSLMKKVYNQDVPCAVCRSRSGSSRVMIPGSNKCQSGWKSEYDGYLMGPHYTFGSGEYLCVDKNPESIAGGRKDENGQLLYLVESRCGSLPCPPYKSGYELTCVVCTD